MFQSTKMFCFFYLLCSLIWRFFSQIRVGSQNPSQQLKVKKKNHNPNYQTNTLKKKISIVKNHNCECIVFLQNLQIFFLVQCCKKSDQDIFGPSRRITQARSCLFVVNIQKLFPSSVFAFQASLLHQFHQIYQHLIKPINLPENQNKIDTRNSTNVVRKETYFFLSCGQNLLHNRRKKEASNGSSFVSFQRQRVRGRPREERQGFWP